MATTTVHSETSVSDLKIPFDTFHNVINGKLVDTATTRHGICPMTEEPLWEVPVATQEDVDAAVAAAKKAFRSWSRLTYDERAAYLFKLADGLEANQESFVELITKEAGKPPQAAGFEVTLALGNARKFPNQRLPEEKLLDDGARTATVRHVPYGVGVGIVPWNFPLVLGISKAFPCLLSGNTFIWKSSPYTPYSALKLAEIATKIFPPGVFQALSGGEELGPMLTAHPDVHKISFTGSLPTGKKVMAACASTMKKVTLELGGNDAAVICEDVDIEAVAFQVVLFSFLHAGQICMNIKRVYVHESIYDKFLAAMVQAAGHLKTGDGPEAAVGPVQNRMQFEKVKKMYAEIASQGWKTAYAEEINFPHGFYLPPTILDNPPESSSIVVEEAFGPILPVLKWTDEEDVINRVNDSQYGLGASAWSKDVKRAMRIGEQLEAGNIWINCHFELDAGLVPAGGFKESGVGVELGQAGLQAWTQVQSIWVKH
ncbi:Aldehyde/histidinol dehydrogenase [Xylariaceae sp. FL0255]|nr:Aldehyde/histidinol dehydrogenase [Xylariaceae sp. FL0255]